MGCVLNDFPDFGLALSSHCGIQVYGQPNQNQTDGRNQIRGWVGHRVADHRPNNDRNDGLKKGQLVNKPHNPFPRILFLERDHTTRGPFFSWTPKRDLVAGSATVEKEIFQQLLQPLAAFPPHRCPPRSIAGRSRVLACVTFVTEVQHSTHGTRPTA